MGRQGIRIDRAHRRRIGKWISEWILHGSRPCSAPGRDPGDWLGLSGKAVLLVGAGGFGFALAKAYLDAGCRVVVADIDKVRLKTLEDEMDTPGVGDRPV